MISLVNLITLFIIRTYICMRGRGAFVLKTLHFSCCRQLRFVQQQPRHAYALWHVTIKQSEQKALLNSHIALGLPSRYSTLYSLPQFGSLSV